MRDIERSIRMFQRIGHTCLGVGLLLVLLGGCSSAEADTSMQASQCPEMFGGALCPRVCSPETAPSYINAWGPTSSEEEDEYDPDSENPESDDEDDPSTADPKVTVAITPDGFDVFSAGDSLGPIEGCQGASPTVCLADGSIDVEEQAEKMKEAYRADETRKGRRHEQLLVDAYDWKALYGVLVELKDEHPDASAFRITAASKIPYGVIVRVMDVARFRLPEADYESREAFRRATPKRTEDDELVELFPDPIYAVARE